MVRDRFGRLRDELDERGREGKAEDGGLLSEDRLERREKVGMLVDPSPDSCDARCWKLKLLNSNDEPPTSAVSKYVTGYESGRDLDRGLSKVSPVLPASTNCIVMFVEAVEGVRRFIEDRAMLLNPLLLPKVPKPSVTTVSAMEVGLAQPLRPIEPSHQMLLELLSLACPRRIRLLSDRLRCAANAAISELMAVASGPVHSAPALSVASDVGDGLEDEPLDISTSHKVTVPSDARRIDKRVDGGIVASNFRFSFVGRGGERLW
ncbi:hypothetical protein HK097_002535 [Rhizophlyctis rosea]|uniref:Uncharacterized protein n=1 Tax=Rhizophlyctis rosea TaxID=64517 RepID=A0AAD5X6I8_9FUNG|nr:hypothetical protein HK097_002535 [Rhizophlyctis rosea]